MRAAKNFVREQFKLGRSPNHIRAVACCSRWANQMSEVDKWIEKGKKIMKKRKKLKDKKTSSKSRKIKKLKIKRRSS